MGEPVNARAVHHKHNASVRELFIAKGLHLAAEIRLSLCCGKTNLIVFIPHISDLNVAWCFPVNFIFSLYNPI